MKTGNKSTVVALNSTREPCSTRIGGSKEAAAEAERDRGERCDDNRASLNNRFS